MVSVNIKIKKSIGNELMSLSFQLTQLSLSFSHTGSVLCLEEVEVAVWLHHHSRLRCQSINLQTIAMGEKKCLHFM